MSTLKERLVELIHSFPKRDLRALQAPEEHRNTRRPSDFFIFYNEHNISFREKSNREIKDVENETKKHANRPRKDKTKGDVKRELKSEQREPKAIEKNQRVERSFGDREKANRNEADGEARLVVSKVESREEIEQDKKYQKGDVKLSAKNPHKSNERRQHNRSSRKEPKNDIHKTPNKNVKENLIESPRNYKIESDESTDSILKPQEIQPNTPNDLKYQNQHKDPSKEPATSINLKEPKIASKDSITSTNPKHPEGQSNELVEESEITNDSIPSNTSNIPVNCNLNSIPETPKPASNSAESLATSPDALPPHYSPPQFSNIQNKSFSESDPAPSCCSKCYIL